MSKLGVVLLLAAAIPLFPACKGGPRVKIYWLDPEQGLVRTQAKEVIPFDHAEGYMCVSPDDFELIMKEYAKCRE